MHMVLGPKIMGFFPPLSPITPSSSATCRDRHCASAAAHYICFRQHHRPAQVPPPSTDTSAPTLTIQAPCSAQPQAAPSGCTKQQPARRNDYQAPRCWPQPRWMLASSLRNADTSPYLPSTRHAPLAQQEVLKVLERLPRQQGRRSQWSATFGP